MKKVLLLCSSHNDLGLIKALRKLGFYIIVTGNKENLVGQKWTDKYIKADYSDKELILKIAKEEKIDNICACCNDYGVYTAAYVAEKLGLEGYDSYDTTLKLHNKDLFKIFAKENKIMSPSATGFENLSDARKIVPDMKLPLIVKPVDCSAGNGINVIRNRDEIDNLLEIAFSKSRVGRILVEPFLEGKQYGFCTFLLDKKVVAVCTNNEYSILNPYRVEIDTFPATGYKEVEKTLVNQVEKIAKLLDLKDGIFHLQYIISDGIPWIIEVMRRTIGNMYHVLGNELNGFNWEYWEARARCGLDCSGFPQNTIQQGYYAYKTILSNSNGVIKNISIPNDYQKYIFNYILLMNIGDTITDYKNQPVGFLFMMFGDETEMRRKLIDEYRNDFVMLE